MTPLVQEYPSLSVIVPAKNESAHLPAVLKDLEDAFPGAEILVVDNASTDGTSNVAVNAGVKVVVEPRPGKGRALRAGAEVASRSLLLFHDADGEYSAHDARAAVERVQAGFADMAIGARMVTLGRVPISSFIANNLIRHLIQWRTRADVDDVLTGTRVFKRDAFLELGTVSPGFAIETEITLKVAQRGGRIESVPIGYAPRTRVGGKKIRARHIFLLIWAALR